ncbi:MAG TPA: uroporphyrinogen-III synthase [Gemmatimonadaceae bacterium]
MTHPLAGRRVVVTRFELEGGPLATALRRAGADPLVVPLIGIDPVADDSTVARHSLRDFDWIAFTSANGVRMFWARLDVAERAVFRAHRGIAAVGPATARAVAALGATSTITAPEFVAESLVDALGDVRHKRILWPRAAGARAVLSDTLRARGAVVVERILYDTVALSVPDETRHLVLGADAITFSSPSAVRAFVACFGARVAPRIVCIGPVTASAARDAGLQVNAVARAFTLDGIVAALSDIFAAEPERAILPLSGSRLQ